MSEHPLDRVFRERLAHQKAGPVDHLWAGIARQQARQRLRRRLFYGGGILAALLLIGALTFFLWADKPPAPRPAEVPLQPIEQRPAEVVPLARSATIPAPVNATESRQEAAAPPAPIADATIPNSTNSAYVADLHFDPNPSTLNRSRTSKLYDTEEQDVTLEAIATAAEELAASEQLDRQLTAAPPIITSPLATEVQALQGRIWMLPNTAAIPSASPSLADPLQLPKRKGRLELEATAGPAYAYQILKAPSELNRPDLDAREISEFPEMSYSANLRVNYRFPNRFSIRAGLSYTSIRNQFEYERRINQQELELVRSVNALRLVEIPLMLGYELPGQRFNLGLSAGPVINLSTSAVGQYLNSESMDPLDLADPNIYRQNAGLAWRINLGTSYRLGNTGSRLLLEPTFTHYPRSFTRDDNPLSERYWMVGLQVGIKHILR